MNQYLIEYTDYNDWANRKLLQTVLLLPDKTEALRLFSHLISSQDKWYNRVTGKENDGDLKWYGDVFSEHEIEKRWKESYKKWFLLLASTTEERLEDYVYFLRQADGKRMKVKLRDIIFQLNCHSIHHRAQINKIISAQGLPVPVTDYIFTAILEAE